MIRILLILLLYAMHLPGQDYRYNWLNSNSADSTEVVADIKTLPGFSRIAAEDNGFGDWLRHLPLKKAGSPVRLYNGRLKANQNAQYRIIDIDVGRSDLQQCADAVMRLRAEYLYSGKSFADIHFKFTSGHRAEFVKWAQGFRPRVEGNRVSWLKSAASDSGYQNFRKYLDTVFMYAGSYSLSREMIDLRPPENMAVGDVFIQGGFPGHAVIVVDMAVHNGKKAFLLAQSYMPAQEVHILKNPYNAQLSPWYILKESDKLYTPEWTFDWADLKRFRQAGD